jgi:hypothetical protein
MNLDYNKFSFAQMTSNSDGKTSASGSMGVACMMTGLLAFLVGAVDHFIHSNNDIMTQSMILVTLGAGLLGYRKSRPEGPASIENPEAAKVEPDEKLNEAVKN